MEIQRIETETDNRIETGPLQINEDWPGVFIRGDDAFALFLALKNIIDDPDYPKEFRDIELLRLMRLLDSSNIGPTKVFTNEFRN